MYPRQNHEQVSGFFLKSGPFPASFYLFRHFNTIDRKQVKNVQFKFCRWLVLDATGLPTEPQPLPWYSFVYLEI